MSPDVTIASIGTELTTGRTRDSHGAFLASLCDEMGLTVRRVVQLPDDRRIENDLREYCSDSELVICTGGLGPTEDDMTRDIVAAVSGRRLVFREELWLRIQAMFRVHPAADTNRKQAEIPEGFTVVENPNGTAPGFHGRAGTAHIVVLPGPPRELRPMCDRFLRPYLEDHFGTVVREESVYTVFLVPESSLEEAALAGATVGLGWRTRAELSRIVFTLYGGTAVDRTTAAGVIGARLGILGFVPGETDAASLLIDSLRRGKQRLAVAESCTGGLIGKSITDIPGSSDVFWGGFITYDNDAKERVLDVASIPEHGAVSAETASEMAAGALERSRVDISIAVTGIAGPGGGSAQKPVGTVYLAVATSRGGRWVRRLSFDGSRERIRVRTAVCAMLVCRGILDGIDVDSDLLWNYI